MIPLYILGLLMRFGAQHGYHIKKLIAEQLADFTDIKLPAIYYHLDKMEKDGLLFAVREKSTSRPEKTVYSVTEQGREAFGSLLEQTLQFSYRPTFLSDGAFYFYEFVDHSRLITQLSAYIEKLSSILKTLEAHYEETIRIAPTDALTMVAIIFDHHRRHYTAEKAWAEATFIRLQKGNDYENGTSSRNRPWHPGRTDGGIV